MSGRPVGSGGPDWFDRAVSAAERSDPCRVECWSASVPVYGGATDRPYALDVDCRLRSGSPRPIPTPTAAGGGGSTAGGRMSTGWSVRDRMGTVQLRGVAPVRSYANLYCETNCI